MMIDTQQEAKRLAQLILEDFKAIGDDTMGLVPPPPPLAPNARCITIPHQDVTITGTDLCAMAIESYQTRLGSIAGTVSAVVKGCGMSLKEAAKAMRDFEEAIRL